MQSLKWRTSALFLVVVLGTGSLVTRRDQDARPLWRGLSGAGGRLPCPSRQGATL